MGWLVWARWVESGSDKDAMELKISNGGGYGLC
jgi:hypothetical protein